MNQVKIGIKIEIIDTPRAPLKKNEIGMNIEIRIKLKSRFLSIYIKERCLSVCLYVCLYSLLTFLVRQKKINNSLTVTVI